MIKRFRRSIVLVFVSVVMTLQGTAAIAHAGLVAATPAPGTGLPQAPGAVVLRFTEPLNYRLSRIEVVDSSGDEVTVGATTPVQGDGRAMQRKLGLLRPGQYTVKWTTVSTLDGHTLRGSYTFGIGTASPGNEKVANDPVSSEGWAGLLGRLVALVGVTLWFGYAWLSRIATEAVVPRPRLLLLGRVTPILASAGTAISAVSSVVISAGTLGAVGGFVASGSGRVRTALIVIGLIAAIVGPTRLLPQRTLSGLALLAEAASGHAAASSFPFPATLSFAVHLGAVGLWVFAIAASLLSTSLLNALQAFTPYAIGAAAATAVTGIASAVMMLGSPSALRATAYGKTVIGKGAALILMATLGLLHNRRRKRADATPARVRSPVRFESLAALMAIILAVILVGFPNPPREDEEAEALPRIDPVLEKLGEKEALSIAGASGPFIVGLTILPPDKGLVEIRLQVMGVEAGDGLRGAHISGRGLEGNSFSADLTPCEAVLGCFGGRGEIPIDGRWEIRAALTSNRGPIQLEEVVRLPSHDGSSELARALRSMEMLRTARMREELRGFEGQEATVSEYSFQSPNAYEIRIRDRHEIVIGETSFTEKAGGGWERQERPGLDFSWPQNYYREFWRGARAVRVLDTTQINAVPSKVVSFVRPELPAWFRIWIGESDGVVRLQQMRAEGHIMDHAFRDLNAPFAISPP